MSVVILFITQDEIIFKSTISDLQNKSIIIPNINEIIFLDEKMYKVLNVIKIYKQESMDEILDIPECSLHSIKIHVKRYFE